MGLRYFLVSHALCFHQDCLYATVIFGDHLKSGQRGSAQNRPTELTQDKLIYTLPAEMSNVNNFS